MSESFPPRPTNGSPSLDAFTKTILGSLLLILGVRLVLASFLPIIPDEAYYRIWAQDLQWGYYDHPPMIAYWIRAGQALFGDTLLGLRLWSVLAALVGSLGIYALAREFRVSKDIALQAALWVQLIWAFVQVSTGGGLAVPDAPATLFWVFSCVCAVRGARLDHIGWWLAAGLLAGLAYLSKYTAFFLAPSLFLWLVTSPQYRAQLSRLGPWLAVIVSVLVFLPNFMWNAAHDWLTFAKQLGRAVPESFSLGRPVIFLLETLLSLGPIIFFMSIIGMFHSIKARLFVDKTAADNEAHSACMHFATMLILPLFGYLVFHGFHSQIINYWLTPVFPIMALLAVLATHDLPAEWRTKINLMAIVSGIGALILIGPTLFSFKIYNLQLDIDWHRHMLILAGSGLLIMGIGMCAVRSNNRPGLYAIVTLSLCMCLLSSGVFWSHFQPSKDRQAWASMASNIEQKARQNGAFWIGTKSYQTQSYLAPHLLPDFKIGQITERARYAQSDESWNIDYARPGLIIDSLDESWSKDHSILPMIRECFAIFRPIKPEYRTDLTGGRHNFNLYLVSIPRRNWLEDGC